MLQRCVALELVVANRLVQHHLKGKKFVLLIINKTGLRIRMTTQLVVLNTIPSCEFYFEALTLCVSRAQESELEI